MRRASFVLWVALASGCGGGGVGTTDDGGSGDGGGPDLSAPDLSPPPDMTLTADEACATWAAAVCAKIDACIPIYLKLGFGDIPTCVDRQKIQCKQGLNLKNTGQTPTTASTCAGAFPNITCDDVLGGALPAPCAPIPGMAANGSACADDSQCMNTTCVRPAQGGCGTCGTAPKAGESCAQLGCARGLFCGPNSKTCVAHGGANAMCDVDHPCVASLVCKGMNNKNGVCSLPSAVDTPCNPSYGDFTGCDFAHGLFCNPFTMKCAAIGYAKPGEACGLVNGGAALCLGAGHCRGTPDAGFQGICIAAAADGAMCDAQMGPTCMAPAGCFQSICKIFDPNLCM